MSTRAIHVLLWGQRVCAITLGRNGEPRIQFDERFLKTSLDIAPLRLPLNTLRQSPHQVHRFTHLNKSTFRGLPSFLVDALPDDFGNALVNSYMARKGIRLQEVTVLDRLAYTGRRAMGAFEFKPATGVEQHSLDALEMSSLVEQARNALRGDLLKTPERALNQLLSVGTSAGGARAKAVVAWNPATHAIFAGQSDVPKECEHWLLKFDGVGPDTELGLSQGFGRVEYAYSLMAKQAGVTMSACRLLEEGGRAHFMTKRFDRVGNTKLLFQSLCGLMELDYRLKSANDYMQYLRAVNALRLGHPELEQAYIRMAFNIMARNCDDHSKNFGFLMQPDGRWELAPAYDVMYAYNPEGEWTYQHLLGVDGKFSQHTRADLLNVASAINISAAGRLLDQIHAAVLDWEKHAETAGVSDELMALVKRELRPL